MNVFDRELPAHFFPILGLMLGATLGVMLGTLIEANVASKDQTVIWICGAWISLLYSTLQFVFGGIFKKPGSSAAIYHGLLVVPIIYGLTQAITHPFLPEPLSGFVTTFIGVSSLFFWPFAAFWLVLFFFFSEAIRIVTGIDTSRISESYRFGVIMEGVKTDLPSIIETMVGRAGFLFDHVQKDGGAIHISGKKKALRLGAFGRKEPTSIRLAFLVYEVEDEAARRPTSSEEFPDFKGQIKGLLESWKSRGKIYEFSIEDNPNIDEVLIKIRQDLGPLTRRVPNWQSIRRRIWRGILQIDRSKLLSGIIGGLIVALLLGLITSK